MIWRCVLCFFLLLPGMAAAIVAVDVLEGGKIALNNRALWCATEPSVGVEALAQGGCDLQPMAGVKTALGTDRRAFWLRLNLANPGPVPVERWIEVGHPRQEEVSLFIPDTNGGWLRRDTGIRTPMALRDEMARTHGVLALSLPPGSEQTVWLRVASRTLLDLSATLWAPNDFFDAFGRRMISVSLALGGLLVTAVLSLLAFFMTRERMYLYFSVAMLSESCLELFRAGLLNRYFWPAELPLPIEIIPLSSGVGIAAFMAFFHVFLTEARLHFVRTYRVFVAIGVLTLLAQLWSILVDYDPTVWSILANLWIAMGILFSIGAWRRGSRSAGILLLSFALLAVLELLRLSAVLGVSLFAWTETLAGPWALVLATPVILTSLFQRSREWQERAARAEGEAAAKTTFLAQMSHELRTPLDTILGNAQLLARHQSAPGVLEGLRSIERNGRHLLGMIDELLDHARAEAGKLNINPTPVDLADFLQHFAMNARVSAASAGNSFQLEAAEQAAGCWLLDERRLRQVLDNLFINALRHTRKGTVSLQCSLTALPKGRARLGLAVSDTGEGIALADQARIFLPFERGSNTAHDGGKGSGMGLAIARQLVNAMGGKLLLESAPGAGTCFRFSLIVERATEVPEQYADRAAGGEFAAYAGRRQRILLVDDAFRSRAVLARLLQDCGFVVDVANSGKLALEMLERNPAVDLVITDQFMADGDGWFVLRVASRIAPATPVILISAAPPERPVGFPVHLKFAEYFLRPLDHHLLLSHIGHLLNLQWTVRQPEAADDGEPAFPDHFPDDAALAEMRHLLAGGEMTAIMEWAEALKDGDSSLDAYADLVCTAARQLDFELLQRLGAPLEKA
jgi:signal transduction histidine kinase